MLYLDDMLIKKLEEFYEWGEKMGNYRYYMAPLIKDGIGGIETLQIIYGEEIPKVREQCVFNKERILIESYKYNESYNDFEIIENYEIPEYLRNFYRLKDINRI